MGHEQLDTVGRETNDRARKGLVEVGDERSGSRGHGGGGTRAIGLELTRLGGRRAVRLERMWLECEAGDWARKELVVVGDERSDSRGHGGGGTQAVGLKLTRLDETRAIALELTRGGGRRAVGLELTEWRQETSVPTRTDMVGVGDERSGSRARGGGGTRAVALELTQWEWQTSGRARGEMVGVGDERLGSN